ncbi:MAG: penicillin-binding transpeptidase domain-containing protein [Chloracidobacterium sp.]|nr:penicillin-binding transpeptidase domain-containing protein [Chloracidobacterium sp.]MDW8217047.1 penicillin-binding transpeptidase domain-containing protein [Acidobacteriota bacterium]
MRGSRRSYATRATAGRRARAREEAALAQRRRAEQARLAALARVRALDEGLRRATQANIEKDDLRGEDPTIRRIALDALGDRAGTVVVMEPTTGRVLSIVNQQWAVRTPFKPCSTIKVLTAYAALQEGLTTADEEITVGGQTWTLRTAMARSNNEYFQVLGRRLGFERVVAYARRAGFGRPTGVNLPGEIGGVTPRFPPANLGRTCSHGDGFGVTAVQLATFISAVANGGTLYRPQILRTPRELATFKPIPVRTLPLSDDLRNDLLAGLLSAVERGTARRSGAAAFGVAGKTGSCTCDFGVRTRVGLFVSFVDAPDKPGLLVTVITKGSTARGSSASIIAGDVYRGAVAANRTRPRQRIVPDAPEPIAAPDMDDEGEETSD